MNAKRKDLKRLSQLADLVLDTELAKLANTTRHRDIVRGQISQLDEDLRDFAQQRASENHQDAQVLSGKDKGWQDWRRTKRAGLNAKLAKAEAERESAKTVTRKAFGRAQVLEELVSKSRE